jgi:predicted Fe-Mo cluster-binding NifX family protein
MGTITIPYAPRQHQLKVHELLEKQRFSVVVAHRRFGKTVAALNHIIKQAILNQQENPRYAYIAPTYGQAKRVAWDYLLKYTLPLGATPNIAELRIDFWGRRIQLYGSDNPDSLRGQYFDGAVIDEVGDQNPVIWTDIIRPALSDRLGWCLFIGTPKGHNHFKDLRDRAETEDGWGLLEFKASQTNVIAESELKAARSEMGEDKYLQEFECSFNAAVEGSYYGQILNDLESKNRFQEIPRDDLCQTKCAWDLGMGDSTAIWVVQIAGSEIRLIDYYENNGVGLDKYVSWLRDNGWDKAEQILPHDVQVRELGSGRSRLEVLQEAGLNIRIAPRMSVDDGIQAVRRLLPRCWFNIPRVKQGLDCLRNYRRDYDEKRKVFFDRPLHDWSSHGSDAFRYLAIGLDEGSSWGSSINKLPKWIV